MTDEAVVSIYALLDEQRQIRYVGHSKDPYWRARKHWRERGSAQVGRKNSALTVWLRGLNEPPAVVVLQEVSRPQRYQAEEYWTDLLRQVPGISLLNIASGARLSEGTRSRIGDAHRGRVLSNETRAKISASTTGRQVSDETKARLSAAHAGRKLSPESIAKRSASVIGSKRSPETRERMAKAAREREERTQRWCDDCGRTWSAAQWPRHVRWYHEGGAW